MTTTERALQFMLSGDSGISSEAIIAHMTGLKKSDSFGIMPPSDASDRGRCIRLLKLIPEWIERLPEMAKYDRPKADSGVVIDSRGIRADYNSWSKQIKLIIKEGEPWKKSQ